jgi:hypothetical protein
LNIKQSEKWGKKVFLVNIQAAAYNGTHKVIKLKPDLLVKNSTYPDFSVSILPIKLSSKLNFGVETSLASSDL